MSSAEPILCNSCDKPGTHVCERCKSAAYCSKKCQNSDWATHRLLCANYATFCLSSRPTKDHFRAILFPVDEPYPKMIWLQCDWHVIDVVSEGVHPLEEDEVDEDGNIIQQWPEITTLLGPNTIAEFIECTHNLLLKRDLSDKIRVAVRNNFTFDGSRPNESLQTIADTRLGGHHFCGPIIAYGLVGTSYEPNHCRDLDMIDFRHLTDQFFTEGFTQMGLLPGRAMCSRRNMPALVELPLTEAAKEDEQNKSGKQEDEAIIKEERQITPSMEEEQEQDRHVPIKQEGQEVLPREGDEVGEAKEEHQADTAKEEDQTEEIKYENTGAAVKEEDHNK